MKEDIMSLMFDLMPIFSDLSSLQSQNIKLSKLHITIKNIESEPNRIYLVIDTDANSKPIAEALTNMLKNLVLMAKNKDPNADVKVFV